MSVYWVLNYLAWLSDNLISSFVNLFVFLVYFLGTLFISIFQPFYWIFMSSLTILKTTKRFLYLGLFYATFSCFMTILFCLKSQRVLPVGFESLECAVVFLWTMFIWVSSVLVSLMLDTFLRYLDIFSYLFIVKSEAPEIWLKSLWAREACWLGVMSVGGLEYHFLEISSLFHQKTL